jgi:hypothetical protein
MKKPRGPREFVLVTLRGSIQRAAGVPSDSKAAGEKPFQQWRHLRSALLVAAVLALIMQGVEYSGWIAGTEGRLLDLFLKGQPAEKPTDPPVILIEIDDDAYQSCFDNTPPLDAKVLQKIVQSLVSVGPSVLGVDIITDYKLPKNRDTYAELRKPRMLPTPIVWAAGAAGSTTVGASFKDWLEGTEDELLAQPTGVLGIEGLELRQQAISGSPDPWEWGLAVLPLDEDLRLRRFPREISAIFVNNGRSDLLKDDATWARKIAERSRPSKIEKDVHEVLLPYSIPLLHYPLLTVYSCATEDGVKNITPKEEKKEFETFKKDADKAVLLLGGTFSSGGDFHETSQGRISGLEINARAVQAELSGKEVREFPRWRMLLLDTAIGSLIGWIFAPEQRLRVLIWGGLAMVALGAWLIWFALKGVWLMLAVVALCAIGCVIPWFAVRGQCIRSVIWASLEMVLLAVLVSYSALMNRYVWVSCVGVALGVNFHVIYEAYKMDLRAPKVEP